VALARAIEFDEFVEVGSFERIGLLRKVHVGSQIINPERLGPRLFLSGFRVQEEHISLDASSVEDAGWKS